MATIAERIQITKIAAITYLEEEVCSIYSQQLTKVDIPPSPLFLSFKGISVCLKLSENDAFFRSGVLAEELSRRKKEEGRGSRLRLYVITSYPPPSFSSGIPPVLSSPFSSLTFGVCV